MAIGGGGPPISAEPQPDYGGNGCRLNLTGSASEDIGSRCKTETGSYSPFALALWRWSVRAQPPVAAITSLMETRAEYLTRRAQGPIKPDS